MSKELEEGMATFEAYQKAQRNQNRANSKDPAERVRYSLESGDPIVNLTPLQREDNIAAACRMLAQHPELNAQLDSYIETERALAGKTINPQRPLTLENAAKAAVANLANISGGITPQNISVNAPPVIKSGSQFER